jgi:hypothetical protein
MRLADRRLNTACQLGMSGSLIYLCLVCNKLFVPGYGTDLGTPHQPPAADSLGNTGAEAAFIFPKNLEPGGPLGILPAAFFNEGVV